MEPGLYRYNASKQLFFVRKVEGKAIWENLETTDVATARRLIAGKRSMAEYVDSRSAAGVTFHQMVDRYTGTVQDFERSTVLRTAGIVSKLKSHFPAHQLVREIRRSDVELFLASATKGRKAATYNEYLRVARGVLTLAVNDRVIAHSPANGMKERQREDPDRSTPSWDQFLSIVESVRAQRSNPDAKDSGDFLEFMGLAGLGQAELGSLTWSKVHWERGKIEIRRLKTQTSFEIPIYPQLRPLLERLKLEASDLNTGHVLKIKDAKKALAHACDRLSLPHFTQRSLRRCFITRCVEHGIDFKTISNWQGHKDGGILIASTYSYLSQPHAERMASLLTGTS